MSAVNGTILQTVRLPGPPQGNTANQEMAAFFTAGTSAPWWVQIDNVGPVLALITIDSSSALTGPVAQVGSNVLRLPNGKSHKLRLAPGQALYGIAVGAVGQLTFSAWEDVVFTRPVC